MNYGKVLENEKKKKKKEQRQPLDENRLEVSLRRRRHLTSISNVCSNELPQVGCEVPFILIGKKTMAFLTDQSWRILKSWYTDKDPGVSQTDLTRV